MSQSDEAPPADNEKRPLQFSLRTMFVVMSGWGVLCAMAATFGLRETFVLAGICVTLTGIVLLCLYDRTRAGAWLIALGLVGTTCLIAILFAVGAALAFAGFAMLLTGYFVFVCDHKRSGTWLMAVPLTFFVLWLIPVWTNHMTDRSGYQSSCKRNLKYIGLALHNYAADHGTFPPAYIADESGNPMHSWRVLILPYMQRNDIYRKYNFDESWDGPNNSKLHDMLVAEYRCDQENPTTGTTETSYLAAVGPNTVFPGAEPKKLSSMTDGVSNTMIIIEVSQSGIHWMEPRDLDVKTTSGEDISANHGAYLNALFGDGSTHTLSKPRLMPERLQGLTSRAGGEPEVLHDF